MEQKPSSEPDSRLAGQEMLRRVRNLKLYYTRPYSELNESSPNHSKMFS
jgi:hypothetical protein